jgi:predicted MFS family arabinose efflux permease
VAVRHIVPSDQLPRALAQNEARGHIATLTGQPLGGLLYAVSAATPVLADALSYAVSAALIARIRGAMSSHRAGGPTGSLWRDIPVGLRHVWGSQFLRVTMLCAAGINMVFAGLSLVIIAAQSTHGTAPVHIGVIFSVGAVGGIIGAMASGPIQRWASPPVLLYAFGWIATAALLAMGKSHSVYVTGALLAAVFCAVAPANAMLFAVQIDVTPPELQGRVLSAAILIGGAAAPLGPLVGGFTFDHFGQMTIFAVFATMMAALTATMHLSPAIRTMRRPGED